MVVVVVCLLESTVDMQRKKCVSFRIVVRMLWPVSLEPLAKIIE